MLSRPLGPSSVVSFAYLIAIKNRKR
uniref:Uncharacterized protein n=1 Tax=Arundo donax TaxID=35708 RepID=A0A0A9AFM3_ARUDO